MSNLLIPEFLKLSLYLFIVFYSNVVQALTGFAGVMLSIPPLIFLYGPDISKGVINILSWLICLLIAWQNRRYTNWIQVRHIVLYMMAGMAVGIFLYRHIDTSFLIPLYGLIIVCVALKNLFLKPWEKPLPEWIYTMVLFGAGIIHGMFVSGGALLVIYLAAKFKDKDLFRANVASVWCIVNLLLIAADFQKGLYTTQFMTMTALGLIPLALALWAGNKIHDRINQAAFRRVTYLLLLAAGSSILL